MRIVSANPSIRMSSTTLQQHLQQREIHRAPGSPIAFWFDEDPAR
jgi:hypothetical protein